MGEAASRHGSIRARVRLILLVVSSSPVGLLRGVGCEERAGGGCGLLARVVRDALWLQPGVLTGLGIAPRFDEPASSEELAKAAAGLCDVERTRAAFVDGRLVGTSQMLSLEVTVPGTGPVPMGGLTAVGVLPTHRRRGLLRDMMRALVDDCHERGEALATLSAAEGSIYGRYGFGPATYQTRWELDIAQARRPYRHEQHGRIELVDAQTAKAAWPHLHDQVRQRRVGEVSAHHGLWDDRAARTGAWQSGRAWKRRQFAEASRVRRWCIRRRSAPV
ncbi:GNAT family N-acetyltransferase [Streptomyces sp. NPDC058572]|uniref:GNAT family N-acetyltransferase n=1 Tax=Streptomyces sp. NPDC058572 TaxID=3346546 RepID=UPI003648A2CE